MTTTDLTTTVSTKGQVILPKAIRDQLHWDAGIRLVVEHVAGGVLLKPVTAPFASTRPEDVFGCLSYKGKAKSVEEMDAGIAARLRRAAGRLDRGRRADRQGDGLGRGWHGFRRCPSSCRRGGMQDFLTFDKRFVRAASRAGRVTVTVP